MPQNDTLGEVPTRDTGGIDLSSGVVKKEPKPDAKIDSGFDLSAGLRPRTKKSTGKPAPKESDSLWNKAWTGLMTPETGTKVATFGLGGHGVITDPEFFGKRAREARAKGHPVAAAFDDLEGYTAGFYKATGDVLSSLTSPGNLALTAATAGGSEAEQAGSKVLAMALRAPGKAAGLWFGAQGLKLATTPQQPGESKYDAFWRQTLGTSAFLGTTHDTITSAKGAFQNWLKKQFGLKDDLAGKVSSQVQQIDQIRKQTAGKTSAIDAETQQHIQALQDTLQDRLREIRQDTAVRTSSIHSQVEHAIEQGKGKITDLQAQRLRQGANTVADTMQAFLQEKARVSKPFDEIAAKIKTEIPKDSVRNIVVKSFEDNGIEKTQIPPRALELLQESESAVAEGMVRMRSPDGHYLDVKAENVSSLGNKGYDVVAKARDPNALTFDGLTRVREDIGQAANAAKDTAVKRALFRAADDVTDFQETIAERNKLGPEYRKAKQNYLSFVRGIGSDMVHTFLDASDAEAQALAPKIAGLLKNGENADGLRTVLKAAGVDVKPLDEIIRQIKEVREGIRATKSVARTALSETGKSSTAATRGATEDVGRDIQTAEKNRAEQVKELEKGQEKQIGKIKEDEVLPGEDVEALSGKSNQQLLEARIRHQMNNAHGGGFVNTWAMTSIVFGLMETVRGSFYGPLLVTKGYLLMNLPKMMRERGVQDWIIRQAGADPASPQAARMRKGIAALGPVLAKSLKSGVPQAAAVKAGQSLGEVPSREAEGQ